MDIRDKIKRARDNVELSTSGNSVRRRAALIEIVEVLEDIVDYLFNDEAVDDLPPWRPAEVDWEEGIVNGEDATAYIPEEAEVTSEMLAAYDEGIPIVDEEVEAAWEAHDTYKIDPRIKRDLLDEVGD